MHQETNEHSKSPEEQESHLRAEAVMSVLEESISLFFRVRAVLEDIHGHSEISGSMRGVMRDLRHQGPMTVPQMARQRAVSRQHIQAIVNELQRAELVILVENPRHKRSRLVKLTATGEQALDQIIEREQRVLRAMDMPVNLLEIQQAGDTLKRVRTMLESPAWRQTVRDVLYQDGHTPENPWLDDSDEFGEPHPDRLHQN